MNHYVNIFRRWWLCLPWILVYGLYIIGLFASGIVAFYQLANKLKLIGLLPLAYGQISIRLPLVIPIPPVYQVVSC